MGRGQPPLTHITFVTDWKAQAEHGGFYEALAEGSMPNAAWTSPSAKADRM